MQPTTNLQKLQRHVFGIGIAAALFTVVGASGCVLEDEGDIDELSENSIEPRDDAADSGGYASGHRYYCRTGSGPFTAFSFTVGAGTVYTRGEFRKTMYRLAARPGGITHWFRSGDSYYLYLYSNHSWEIFTGDDAFIARGTCR